MNTFEALGGIGGLVALVMALAIFIRGVSAQISSTKENTKAIINLTAKIESQDGKLDNHGQRIATLEGAIANHPIPRNPRGGSGRQL